MRKRGPRGEQPVLRILFGELRRDSRRLPVGRRHHQLLVEALHIPAAVAEIHRQPVEQFRMARPRAHDAEILGRLHDPGAEYFLPHAIDGDPRGQRIGRAHRPLRQAEPVERRAGGQRRQEMRHRRPNPLGARVVDAASQHVGIRKSGRFLADQRNVAVFRKAVQFAVERGELCRQERVVSSRCAK